MQVLNFKETASLLTVMGKSLTVMVRGEAGIGKSSLGAYLKETEFPNHNLIMFDASVRSEGDVGLPWLVEINGKQVTTYAPSELFGLHLDGPSIVVIDELTKAGPGMINQLLPVLLERRFNVNKLHPDTILFCTGNLTSELLGDVLPAHALNRVMDITMRKPRLVDEQGYPGEWLKDYAIPRGAPVSAIGFCLEYPQIFADYSESSSNNPYIHKPGNVTGQFVTPRSFSNLIFELLPRRDRLSSNVFFAAMVGLVGIACAESFNTYLKVEMDLPTTVQVLEDPVECRLPNKPVERLMMTYRLAQGVSAQNIDKIAAYVKRFGGETRALFTYLVSTDKPALNGHLARLKLLQDLTALRTA